MDNRRSILFNALTRLDHMRDTQQEHGGRFGRHSGPPDQADDNPGTSSVPSLINDRSQEDAHHAQGRELTRLQQEVFTAAAREANDIVSSTRSEVRRVILQARRDLLMLAAQVDVVGHMATDGASPPDATPRALAPARQDLRQVLHEASSELRTVTSYAQALQSPPPQVEALPADYAPAEASMPVAQPSAWDAAERAKTSPRPAAKPRQATHFRQAKQTARGTRILVSAFALALAIVTAGLLWMARSRERASTVAPLAAAPSATSRPAPGPTTPSSAKAALPSAPSLSVEVKRQAWIRLVQDDRVILARLVQPGETFRIADAREVSIRSGDAGAVLVSVNGADAKPLGGDGQVLTRTIVLKETKTPAATPPAVKPQSDVKPSNQVIPPAPLISTPSSPAVGDRPQSSVAQTVVPTAPVREELTVSRPAATPPPVRDVPAASNATSGANATPATPNLQTDIARAAERWLDAYYRNDRTAMSSLSAPQLILSDERGAADRLPPGLAAVRRDMQDVSVRIFGSDAMYVARMNERLENAPAGSSPGAFVSQIWTMRDGAWRLTNVRIVSAASVSRSVR